MYNLKLPLLKTSQAALKVTAGHTGRQLQKTPGDVFSLRTVLSTAHSCSPNSTWVCVNWHTSCNVWAARKRRKTSPTKPFQWGKLKIPTQKGWKPQSLSFPVHGWPEPAGCTGKRVTTYSQGVEGEMQLLSTEQAAHCQGRPISAAAIQVSWV